MYQLDVGPLPTVVLASPEAVTEGLTHRAAQGRPYNAQRSFRIMMKGLGVDGALPGFAGSQGRNWREQRSFFVGQLRKNSAAGVAAAAAAAAAAVEHAKEQQAKATQTILEQPSAQQSAQPQDLVQEPVTRSRRSSAVSADDGTGSPLWGFGGYTSAEEVSTVVEEEAAALADRTAALVDAQGGGERKKLTETASIIVRLFFS